MNQILSIPRSKSYIRFFKIQLIISSIIIFFSCLFLFFYFSYNKQESSSIMLDNYRLHGLYSATEISYLEKKPPTSTFILGTISIDKIGLFYPIISDCSDELLELSICRFYGPVDSSDGNLCLAGHNYNDNTFFSRLSLLEIGDKISVSFWDDITCEYALYEKYETSFKDTSCTLQDTNGKKEITLVTCNNFTGNRMIFKASEI